MLDQEDVGMRGKPTLDQRRIEQRETREARETASDLSARTLTTERVVREKGEPKQKTPIPSDLRCSRSVKSDTIVQTVVDTQAEQEEPVTEGSDLDASAPGADAIGPNFKGRSVIRRRGNRGASTPGADAVSSADGFKRPASEPLACSRAAGLYKEAQIGILSDVERMECEAEELKHLVTEGADALSAKSKKERFDEQSWDSLKSSPLYEVLREYKDLLPDDIPAELPQGKGFQY
ncbi:unnamed protein product [Phytophthora fragariaefolia]|uniref:Unnamed protein product n=1 Tax=Phytophthora fragariaefolia TaxID=1490495 RepID=A0A9W7CRD2_9STRA|nr:unnamed protein product [Phytophthora fragariaefolia]